NCPQHHSGIGGALRVCGGRVRGACGPPSSRPLRPGGLRCSCPPASACRRKPPPLLRCEDLPTTTGVWGPVVPPAAAGKSSLLMAPGLRPPAEASSFTALRRPPDHDGLGWRCV